MKNYKRELRASEAEKIRQILEDQYISLLTDVLIAEDDIRDDSGDYYTKQPIIDRCNKEMSKIESVIQLVGGFSCNPFTKARNDAFGW